MYGYVVFIVILIWLIVILLFRRRVRLVDLLENQLAKIKRHSYYITHYL